MVLKREKAPPIVFRDGRQEALPIESEHAVFYAKHGIERNRDRHNPGALFPMTGDIQADTAVCVTARFSAAALFPPRQTPGDDTPAQTWIYAMLVRCLFNTHERQVIDGLTAIHNEVEVRGDISKSFLQGGDGSTPPISTDNKIADQQFFVTYAEGKGLWPLYAHELATKLVDARDVICAIKCVRSWSGPSWRDGATYHLVGDPVKNESCRVEQHFKELAFNFVVSEPTMGRTPERDSGFHRSEASGL
ncbi:MAG TPA: hypothetical protein VFG30_28370 [Polyangiales bacterium]|nr:hypothetical protein [Polyangiales bacterium]